MSSQEIGSNLTRCIFLGVVRERVEMIVKYPGRAEPWISEALGNKIK
jgi:hypothetical protein